MLLEATKTDPRVKRTRQLLQKALMELAQEKPLDGITVQDIAARAEVNRATFYAHFADKYDLMNYTMREMFQARLDEKLLEGPGLTSDNLRTLILTTCEYLGEFIGHCTPSLRISEQAVMFMQVQTHLYETLLAWFAAAPQLKLNAAPEIAATTASWAIWGMVFQWAREGRKLAPERLADQLQMMFETGLCDKASA